MQASKLQLTENSSTKRSRTSQKYAHSWAGLDESNTTKRCYVEINASMYQFALLLTKHLNGLKLCICLEWLIKYHWPILPVLLCTISQTQPPTFKILHYNVKRLLNSDVLDTTHFAFALAVVLQFGLLWVLWRCLFSGKNNSLREPLLLGLYCPHTHTSQCTSTHNPAALSTLPILSYPFPSSFHAFIPVTLVWFKIPIHISLIPPFIYLSLILIAAGLAVDFVFVKRGIY